MTHTDGVIAGSADVDASLLEEARKSGKAVLEYQSPDEVGFYENYNRFYDELF